MFNFIFIILIIWIIITKTKTTDNNILKSLFKNCIILKQDFYSTIYSIDNSAENYIIKVVKNSATISKLSIEDFVEFSKSNHYHNLILVKNNAIITPDAQSAISNYQIKVINNIMEISNIKNEKIIHKMPLDDNCIIDESPDPIQDGNSAISLFNFRNKTEKL